MSRRFEEKTGPSQRMLRVAEMVRHALAELMLRGDVLANEPIDTRLISVPEVRMSPDLKLATAFITPLGKDNAKTIVAALDRHKKYLRLEVTKKIQLKFSPEIRFRVDESTEKASRIDAILRSEAVVRDLSSEKSDDDA